MCSKGGGGTFRAFSKNGAIFYFVWNALSFRATELKFGMKHPHTKP